MKGPSPNADQLRALRERRATRKPIRSTTIADLEKQVADASAKATSAAERRAARKAAKKARKVRR